MKKLLAVLVLSSLTVIGCEKPVSSKKSVASTPPEAMGAAAEGREKGAMEAKAASDKAKADAEKAKADADKAAKDKPK